MTPVGWRRGALLLGLYEVRDVIESGGMGLVYRVRHRHWNMDLAVKVPRPERTGTAVRRARFEQEAGTWVGLGPHPNVVNCVYVRRIDDHPCVFAEWVDGGSLGDLIRDGRLYAGDGGGDDGGGGSCARVLDLAVQTAWGIHHAHQEELVHQDVKPANVMIDVADGWTAKVTDFGIARALATPGEHTAGPPGVSYGGLTPEYCSPEQAHAAVGARVRLTRATDVWSWALCVLEMFTGGRHWRHGQAAPEVLAALREGRLPQACPMPAALADVLRKCFATEPVKRPQHLGELASAVADIYADVVGTPYPRLPPQGPGLLTDGLSNRALSLLDLDRADEAEELWRRAAGIDPHHPSTVYNWAVYRWRQGRLSDEEVLAQLGTARNLEGERRQANHLLGLVHVERGADEAARELLAAAPDVPEVAMARSELARRARLPEPARLTGHRGAVTALAVDATGRVAVSGGEDGRLLVWEPAEQRCRAELGPRSDAAPAAVTGIAVCGDGAIALVARGEGPVEVWDLTRQVLLRELPAPASCATAVAVNRSGTGVVACDDGRFQVWDTRTGRLLRDLTHPATPYQKGNPLTGRVDPEVHYRPAPVHVVAITEGADLVITAAPRDGSLVVWDVGPGRPRHQLVRSKDGYLTGINVVAPGADGTYALLVNGSSRTMHIWEPRDDRTLSTVPTELNPHQMVAVSADGRIAVSVPRGSYRQQLRVWETDSGRCLRTMGTRPAREAMALVEQRCVAISGDGRIAVLGDNQGGIRVHHLPPLGFRAGWSYARPRGAAALDDGETQVSRLVERAARLAEEGRTAEAAAQVRAARAVPGYERHPELREIWAELGRRAGGDRTGLLGLWLRYDMRGGTFTFTQRVTLALTPDAELMVTGGTDGFVRVWELQTGQGPHAFPERAGKPHTILLADEGRLAVTADWSGTAHIWDLTSGTRRGELSGDQGRVRCVSVDRSGRHALVGDDNGALCLWRLDPGTAPHRIRTMLAHDGPVRTVRLSDDGKYAASAGSDDRAAVLWRTATGTPLLRFPGSFLPTLRFDAAGGRLFATSDDGVTVWDVRTLRQVCTRQSYPEPLALSADGRVAVTRGLDTVDVWETGTGRTVCELPVLSEVFDLSPDGRYVLTAGFDKVPRLWDARTGRCVHVLEPHPSTVTTVLFTADGRNAVSADARPAIRLWELDWDYDFTAGDGTAETR
ncbi:WD40 repeat domain-containing serine/threonine protein kinase [Streptomyces sp. UG1]|uniref:WD40 repeat domain-containing serine/threonine protein kinase n=1 Tax=Streptomyces sp. UG1 TaxID=3417652 RepID=UPI003CF1EE60